MSDRELPLFYSDLARWWPLISPAADYEEEAFWISELLVRGRREVLDVLELGSGGGHNASHLKHRYALTLVDLSRPMLDVSQGLDPQ